METINTPAHWRRLLAGFVMVFAAFQAVATLAWPIALTSVALSVIISFPLAHLFEMGGRTIWAPAIVHFAVQAVAKLVMPREDGDGLLFPLAVLASSALVPLAAFLVPRSSE